MTPRKRALMQAREMERELLGLMTMNATVFDALTKLKKERTLYNFLGLNESDVAAHIRTLTIATLREYYLFDWIELPLSRFDYMELLVDGSLVCRHCCRENTQGVLQAKKSTLKDHDVGTKHVKRVAKWKKKAASSSSSAASLASSSSSSASTLSVEATAPAPLSSTETLHQPTLARYYGREGSLPGFATESDRAMSFLAAKCIVASMPYTKVPELFDATAFGLIQDMRSGMCQSKALREVRLPQVNQEIRREQARQFRLRKYLYAAGDGGSAVHLLGRSKIYAICAGGSFQELLIDLKILGSRHENTLNQAWALHTAFLRAGITPKQLRFLVADSASVNNASVKYLNKYLGWNIQYRRCVPHLLNLIMVKVMQPIEDKFHFASFLKHLRGYYNAGGIAGRKTMLTEAAVNFSALDFVETRWFSLISATTTLVSQQTVTDFKRAHDALAVHRSHLEEELTAFQECPPSMKKFKAAIPKLQQEIQEIADALEEEDKPRYVWDAVYETTEGLKAAAAPAASEAAPAAAESAPAAAGGDEEGEVEKDSEADSVDEEIAAGGGAASGKKRKKGKGLTIPKESKRRARAALKTEDDEPQPLLDFLANDMHFAVALLLHRITDGAAGIFKAVQAGPDWVERWNRMEADDVAMQTKPIRDLLATLRNIGLPAMQKSLVEDVMKATLAHTYEILEAGVNYDEVSEADLDREKKKADARVKTLAVPLAALLEEISTSVSNCAALRKLEVSLGHLDLKFQYDPTVRPKKISADAGLTEIFDQLGVPTGWCDEHKLSAWPFCVQLKEQWKKYCDEWIPAPPGRTYSPEAVNSFWISMEGAYPELADIAQLNWAAPINSAGPERFFSELTAMDDPRKAKTGELTFMNTAFIKGNKATTLLLAAEAVEESRLHQTAYAVSLRADERTAKEAKLALKVAAALSDFHANCMPEAPESRKSKKPSNSRSNSSSSSASAAASSSSDSE